MKSHTEAQRHRAKECALIPLRASVPLCEFVLLVAILLAWSRGAGTASAVEPAPTTDLSSLVGLLELIIEADPDSARQCLQTIGSQLRSGEVDDQQLAELKTRLA